MVDRPTAARARPHTLTPGVLFQLVRQGQATSRAELARTTGLARSTVSQRVDALLHLGLLVEQGGGPSTGGRPPTQLVFDAGRAISPPIMPGWDGVPVPPAFADQYPGVPVLVDNDVNVMALGEYW